jgi:signal transduction histidine kinase
MLAARLGGMAGAIWSTDDRLVVAEAEGRGLPALAAPPHELVGRRVDECFSEPVLASAPLDAHRQALAGEPAVFDHVWNGWVCSGSVTPVRDDGGAVAGTLCALIDRTEAARPHLDDETVDIAIREAPAGFWTVDRELRFTSTVGRATTPDFYGMTLAEVTGDPGHPVIDAHRAALRGESLNLEVEVRGTTWHAWIEPLVQHGEIVGVRGVSVDIGERKRLEQQLRQSQKMEALGRLASGVAHDFNNILTVIAGATELALADAPPEPPSLAEDLREVREAAQRATGLVGQLLAFSRPSAGRRELVRLNELIASLQPMLRRLIGAHVRLDSELAAEPLVVPADPTSIEQVLVNLAVNASEAMPEGGSLTIRTEHTELERPAGVLSPGSYAVVRVRDTGRGMDPETAEHALEPFFTTKGEKGTGLGLATVHRIAHECGGTVEIDAEPGRGTTFSVYLREAAAPAAVGSSSSPVT